MIRLLLIIYLFTACFNKLTGQVNFFKADDNTVSIMSSIDSLNELAFKVKKYDIANALKYLEAAKSMAVKNNYKKGLSVSILYEGGIFFIKTVFPTKHCHSTTRHTR